MWRTLRGGSVYPLGDLVVGGQLIWKGINSLMLQLLGEPIWVWKTYEYAWEWHVLKERLEEVVVHFNQNISNQSSVIILWMEKALYKFQLLLVLSRSPLKILFELSVHY